MGKRKTVGVRELRNRVSRIVHEVREKEAEYVVTNRGKPVALLRPLDGDETSEERAERVARALERMRRTAKVIGELSGGKSAVEAVSRQRR